MVTRLFKDPVKQIEIELVKSNDMYHGLERSENDKNCTVMLEGFERFGPYTVKHTKGFLFTIPSLKKSIVVIQEFKDLEVFKIIDQKGEVLWEKRERGASLEERKKGALIAILKELERQGRILSWTLRPVGEFEDEVVVETEKGHYAFGEYDLESLLRNKDLIKKEDDKWIKNILDLYAVNEEGRRRPMCYRRCP